MTEESAAPSTTLPTAEAPPASSRRPRLRPLLTLLPFALRHKGRIAVALVALVVAAAVTLAVPLAVRRIIDFGFKPEYRDLVNLYFGSMVWLVAALALASAARYYSVMTLGERVVAEVRSAVFAHLTRVSPAFYDSVRAGEIVSRLAADTTLIKSAFGASASIALRNLVLLLGAIAMMVVTSPRLSVLVLAAIPIIVLPLVGFGRVVRKRSRRAQDTLADASALAAEAIGAMRTVQAFTAERALSARYDHAVEEAYQGARHAAATRSVLTAVAIFLIFASVVGVLWWGASDVLGGRMSAGTLGQFLLYAVFGASSLSQLSDVWGEIAQATGAAERLSELLHAEVGVAEPPRPAALPEPARGAIAFEGVRFAYPARPSQPVFRNLSLTVAPGERVAVVGPSGAGKSTLFQLLLRFYDPTGGHIRLDGIDLRDASLAALRTRIALVPQDPVVFAGTARDNIRFGRPDASDAAVIAAARAAAADDFIRALPEGYDTEIGERGVTLSGGQRQRLAIARAVLRDAPVLLLDEATSSLDAESETLVQEALDRLMQGRTTLVIAHRLATVLTADRILVLDHGEIVESGTHRELVARGGLYARLATLQFRDLDEPERAAAV
jgi:ATP-binding cassette subfamily B protein